MFDEKDFETEKLDILNQEPLEMPKTYLSYAKTEESYVDNNVNTNKTYNYQDNYYQRMNNNYNSAYSNSTYTNPYVKSQPIKRPKKEKKPLSRGAVAVLLVVCVLLSGVCGFGGALLYKTYDSNLTGGSSDNGMIVHQVAANEVEETKLVDKSTSTITEEVADSVVEITTEVMTTSSFYGQYTTQGAGSGVIISNDNKTAFIVTNNHVIENATKIAVTTRDGKTFDAVLVGTDKETDIALLKIEASGLKTATFSNSESLKVGDKVVAIGNPLGSLGGSVSEGIISALNRKIEINGETQTLLQTDAAINPGNSGGGLFNGQGELIGIVNAKSTGENVDCLGFAIPVNDVLEVLPDLKEYGYVTGRGDLGFQVMDVSNNLYAWYQFKNNEPGVYISSVTRGSSAAKAGLEPGYRIISVNGKEVSSSTELDSAVDNLKAGDEITVTIAVNNGSKDIKYKLDEYVPSQSNSNDTSDNGNYYGEDDGSGGFDFFDFFG